MLSFRPAHRSDAARLWAWRNDPASRAASVSSEPISFDEHVRWLDRVLSHPDVCLFVVYDTARDVHVGSVRYDLTGDAAKVATISVVVDPQQRGRGYAVPMIKEVVERATAAGAAVAHAVIHPDNAPSMRAFWQVGFRPDEMLNSERPAPPFFAWRMRLRDEESDVQRTHDGGSLAAGSAAQRPGAEGGAGRPARKARR